MEDADLSFASLLLALRHSTDDYDKNSSAPTLKVARPLTYCDQSLSKNVNEYGRDNILSNEISFIASQPSLNFHKDFYRNSSYDNECSNAAESRELTLLSVK